MDDGSRSSPKAEGVARAPSPESASLLNEGATLMFRLLQFPRPLVMAAPGHAMALGAIILMSGDLRVGGNDLAKCKVGLNEVHIGMPMPRFGMELARWRMSPLHRTRAVTLGQLYTPAEAVDVGYLDVLVPGAEIESRAVEMAQQLSSLGKPFHVTKMFDRGALLQTCQQVVALDVADFGGK